MFSIKKEDIKLVTMSDMLKETTNIKDLFADKSIQTINEVNLLKLMRELIELCDKDPNKVEGYTFFNGRTYFHSDSSNSGFWYSNESRVWSGTIIGYHIIDGLKYRNLHFEYSVPKGILRVYGDVVDDSVLIYEMV